MRQSDSHLDQSRDRQVYVLITSIFLMSGKFLIFVVSESTFFTVTESLLYGSRFFWSSLNVSISVSWIGSLDQKLNAGLIGIFCQAVVYM